MKYFHTSCAIILTAMVSATPSEAGLFDFASGSLTGSGFGNFLEMTDDGITMNLTGWGIGNGAGGTFSEAQLRQWPTGLGNCNMGEGTNCPSGPHAADNNSQLDVFFMTFSAPVFAELATITAWADDYDVSFWGGTDPTFDIAGKTVLDLGQRFDSNVGGAISGSSTRDVDLTELNLDIRWLAFGARAGQSNDRFKFEALAFTVPTQVPEPATFMLALLGALGLAARRRR